MSGSREPSEADPNGDTTKLREQNHGKLTNKAKSDRRILRAAPRLDRSCRRGAPANALSQQQALLVMLCHDATVERGLREIIKRTSDGEQADVTVQERRQARLNSEVRGCLHCQV